MRASKQKARKNFKRKKKLRNYNVKKKYSSKMGWIIGSSLSFPFPQMLRSLMRTCVTGGTTRALAGTDGNAEEICFKLNSVYNVGAGAVYPLGAATSFLGNVPTGLYYLASSNSPAAGGSVAPYQKILSLGSSIKIEISTEATTNHASEVIIVPRAYNNIAAPSLMVGNTLAEQPRAKAYLIPPVLNEKPFVFRHSCSAKDIFGLTSLDTTDEGYVGNGFTDPANLATWVVRVRNVDGSTSARQISYKATIIHDCIFFNMNNLTSAIPS